MKKKVLIFGGTGMLGSTLIKYFSKSKEYIPIATYRNGRDISFFPSYVKKNLIYLNDIFQERLLIDIFEKNRPNIVINCIGIIKQNLESYEPLNIIPINSLFPHLLSKLCSNYNSKLIQVSTDCIFSGLKGMYKESDIPDPIDLYGKSKLLGEIDNNRDLTIRTSLIGHEIYSSNSLIDWFISQDKTKEVKGFSKAIFSGFPTIEIANILENYIFKNHKLKGIIHISADPISKYELLKIVDNVYKTGAKILPDDRLVIDRSLDSSDFKIKSGYKPKSWDILIKDMHTFRD